MTQNSQTNYMMKSLILLFLTISVVEGSYSCAQSTGVFKNDYDYRSYYTCSNYCDNQEYCSKTTEYYSSITRRCQESGFLWSPVYNLTGTQEILPFVQYRHFQQSNYDVYWSSETKTHLFSFIGRYVNETYVDGTETILSLQNKCVLARDVQLLVRGTKSFCANNVPNPYSMKCELPVDYVFSGCINY